MLRFIVLIVFIIAGSPVVASERLLVFAAASQRDVLETLGAKYQENCSCQVIFSFASTAVLARQIDAGANPQLFVSASTEWMDWLQDRGKVDAADRHIIAGNQLVIASTNKTTDSFDILKRQRFAMADPQSVPAGIYAAQALRNTGLWDEVKDNAVYAENVRLALYSIRRGDLLSGIVYRSDLTDVSGLHVHHVFPDGVHDPIRYVIALLEPTSLAKGFVDFLRSAPAQDIFVKFGFSPSIVAD